MTVFQSSRKTIVLFIAGIIFLVFAFVNFSNAQTETGLQILLSGKLKDSQDVTAQTGEFNMSFSLYETASSTDNIWNEVFIENNKVIVENGIFQVSLGLQNILNLDFENNTYLLGITIGGTEDNPAWDQEMSPRIPVTTLKNLLFSGTVTMTEEELVNALIDEFQKNATSSEGLTQTAFINFLKQKLNQAGTSAVIISPNTISLLLEQIIEIQNKYEQGLEAKNFWQSLLSFFTRIFDALSEKLGVISDKISAIFDRLNNIDQGVSKIINILENQNCGTATAPQNIIQQPSINYDANFLVKDFGKTILKFGDTTIRIFSRHITENTKIFVLPTEPIEDIWWISDRKVQEYFEISINISQPKDINFEYWIIVPKSELPPEPASIPPETTINTLPETTEPILEEPTLETPPELIEIPPTEIEPSVEETAAKEPPIEEIVVPEPINPQ